MKVALIGFMGAGKTWLGKRLSTELKTRFLDLDDYIEKQEKSSISEIFQAEGEAGFRVIEQKHFSKIASRKSLILSTGGGLPMYKDNMEALLEQFFTIYLHVEPGILADRLFRSKTPRPLIAGLSREETFEKVGKMLKERMPVYEKAHLIIDASRLKSQKRVLEISEQIKAAYPK